MPEPVRLVIWDLDETFWNGTQSEGPITQIALNQAVVRELAHRGILSAICSKNDFDRVKTTLLEEGLWDYFIFPSINWEPKGPRIQALIDSAQLRPASVLFIDDNPSNLKEAKHFNPEIQISGLEIIGQMLSSPLFAGKPDPGLVRLNQYKALEQRKADEAASSGGVEDFLRQSDIRVEILYELGEQLDRIVELINRTNQLNFTKRRLPEDGAAARAEMAKLLGSHEIQAALVHVVDRYGDHGLAGFYMVRNDSELLHFCFSCRILGMGVETWLYRKLGRPRLKIVPEVLTDPIKDARRIDWITLTDLTNSKDISHNVGHQFDWVAARGGCDLQALSHYFKVSSPEVIGEFNVGRGGFDARVDHSIFLRYALEGLNPDAIQESVKLGYRPEDFKTSIMNRHESKGLIILSFWADVSYALYRHRRLNFMVPFALSGRANHSLDARSGTPEELPENLRQGWMASALATLQQDYDFVGIIDEHLFKSNLQTILDALPGDAPVVLLQGNTRLRDRNQGVMHTSTDNVRFNAWIAEAAANRPRVKVVNIRELISTEDEVSDWSHFDRIVYYRLFKRISLAIA
ncbi:MAG: HAD-IIIC family phosphatase [Steroidobacteraceae bacterium]